MSCWLGTHRSYYCRWFRNLANQLRLVVYTIIYRVLAPSQVVQVLPSTVSTELGKMATINYNNNSEAVSIPASCLKLVPINVLIPPLNLNKSKNDSFWNDTMRHRERTKNPTHLFDFLICLFFSNEVTLEIQTQIDIWCTPTKKSPTARPHLTIKVVVKKSIQNNDLKWTSSPKLFG